MDGVKMKQTFFILTVLILISSGRVSAMSNESIHLTAGPGMLMIHPYGAGLGFNAGFGVKVSQTSNSALFVGADLGLGFLGDVNGYTITSASTLTNISIDKTGATTLHILPTIYWRTNLSSSVRQYIGVSMGPNIWIQSFPSSTLTSSSETKVFFEFLFRPGIEVALSDKVGFLFEPKFGIIKTSFVFLPQMNVLIAF